MITLSSFATSVLESWGFVLATCSDCAKARMIPVGEKDCDGCARRPLRRRPGGRPWKRDQHSEDYRRAHGYAGRNSHRRSTDRVPSSPERTAAIVQMRENGRTYDEIGRAFGVTHERVRQILKRAGVVR